jgi:RNA polymerase sigma factor (sigma-70 family)
MTSSFDAAFERLYPRARIMAYRILGDVGRSEEIASEALARAYARWSKLSTVDYVDAWVLRVTVNLAIDVTRRRPPPVVAPTPGDAGAELAVLRLALVEALRSLPPRQREAIALRYLADLRETDVAEALGISLGSVKTHVHRGLDTLRRRMGSDRAGEVLDHV